MQRTNLHLFIFMFVSVSFALAQNGNIRYLSLDEAQALAQKQSFQLQIARSQLSQTKGQNLESLSGFLPSVSLSENYIKSNDPVTVFSLKLKQGIFTQQDFDLNSLNKPNAVDNFTTALLVQQPVLNLDAIYGKSAAKLAVQARKQALNRAGEAVALQVKKAYYGLLLAQENLTAIEEAVQSARVHRDNARAAFEQGLINQADYLAAEVRLAELQEQRITAKHQIANASDGLKFVMGLTDESLIVPTDSLELAQNVRLQEYSEDMLESRSDLQAIKFQAKSARRMAWMKRSSWIPRLNAFGTIEWNASEAFRKDASNWAVGLQLQWQIFNGFKNVGQTKQAAAKVEEVDVQMQQTIEKAKMEARQAKRNVQAARERIRVAQAAIQQATESLRIVEERFKQGLEKTSDLLDKEVALTNMKLRLLKAQHDYAIAWGELQFTMGVI